ncbi:MAG TPA: hypothetical protein VGG10_14230 [Rhizomicrobium sp.]|jgi:hypothetical protein
MRGVVAALVLILAAAPAAADGWGHQRMQLPPPSPAFADSDGNRYDHLGNDQGPPPYKNDLQRFADQIGAGKNGRTTDLFRYSLDRDEVGGARAGAAIAGAVSNGAAEIQLRWNN